MNNVQNHLAQIFRLREPLDGEYVNEDDKLIYCCSCKTPKQKALLLPGSDVPFYPPVMCKCERERAEAEEAERNRVHHIREIDRLRSVGFPDSSFRKCLFENDAGYTPQIDKALAYAENFEKFESAGEGLLLWGDVGSGKTYMAACIANALMEREIPVLMTDFSRILLQLTGGFSIDKNEYLDNFQRYRLLIIDDLGIERKTEFALEQIYAVIDRRYQSGKPMIITTNLQLSSMKSPENMAQARIYDRILEKCFPIMVTGNESIRKKNASERFHEYKDLLNRRL